MQRDARYRWVGELPTWQARRAIQTSWLSVNSSQMEGGANSVAESIVARVPVLATRIPGNVGMLGEAYPGFLPAGDERALAGLIRRAATEPGFYAQLVADCSARAPLFDPARERAALSRVVEAVHPVSETNSVT
jgi:glycosyltransferase involved in cell wall biosynthesis